MYENHLVALVDVEGDDVFIAYHRACTLRSYLMVLVGTSILWTKVRFMLMLSILDTSLTWI